MQLNTVLTKLAYQSLSKSAVSRGKSIYHLLDSLKYITEKGRTELHFY